MKEGVFILHCDGAARGNPGPGSYGFVVLDSISETPIAEGKAKLGNVTNNIAEYTGLVKGLEHCLSLKISKLIVKSDSELLVRQMKGQYAVKSPNLKPLFATAKTLAAKFERVDFIHVRREENALADELANLALDS